MPRRIDYTDDAIDDLLALRRWLTQPGAGGGAKRRLQAIRHAVETLRERPCLHAVRDHPGARELPCNGGYRVMYEVRPDTGRSETAGDVLVLRIFGPGQSRDRL